jgi:hypothetical protein
LLRFLTGQSGDF